MWKALERTLNLCTIEHTMQARKSRMLTPDIFLIREDERVGLVQNGF